MSESVCTSHFPVFRFGPDGKKLWDPVSRKERVNRPEERVRLRMVDYLTLQAGVSRNRIALETPLRKQDHPLRRGDLLVYDSAFEPDLLIECKAASVPLDEKAAVQIARYNERVGARRLCLTNGVADMTYRVEPSGPVLLGDPPYPEQTSLRSIRSAPGYWVERGFIGAKTPLRARDWIRSVLDSFWEPGQGWSSGYFDLSGNPWKLDLSHYHRIEHLGEQGDLLLGILSPDSVTTWLVAIVGKSQSYAAMMITDLARLAEGGSDDTTLFTINEQRTLRLGGHVPLSPSNSNPMIVHNLPGFYGSWFNVLLSE